MTNEQTKNEEGEETQEQDSTDEEKTQTKLDEARLIMEAQKRENDRREALIDREENLQARKDVGGEAEAGAVAKPKEETDEEYHDKFKAGEVNPFKNA